MIDHLVYVAPDLATSIDHIASVLGVTPAVGGRHPRWGTQNAVLSLGPSLYLEIMGPDGTPVDDKRPRPFGIDALQVGALKTWVVRSADLPAAVSAGRRSGIDLGEIQHGSRTRPDGVVLQWTMTDLTAERRGGIIPYLIDWGDTPHPAPTAPGGCLLEGFRLFHPDAEALTRLLAQLGIPLEVERGPVGMAATIQTPRGQVVLR